MNMKKTIAAIAAGAVAVSAMATTVSAVEAKTLNYNLTATLARQNDGNVTVKATFPNVALTTGTNAVIRVTRPNGEGWNDRIVLSGQYIDTNKAINPITFTHDRWSDGYSAAEGCLSSWADPANGVYYHVVTLPVKAVNDGTPALIGGEGTAAVDAVTAVAAATEVTAKSAGIAEEIADIKVQTTAFAGLTGGNYTIKYDNAQTKWFILDNEGFATATAVQVQGTTPADDETLTVKYTAPVEGVTAVPAAAGTQTANITVTATIKSTNFGETWDADVSNAIANGKLAIEIDTNGSGYKKGDTTYSNLTVATKYKMPFRTTLNDNTNIITYLENANVVGDDKHYVNVRAVLNDAIENYDGVTFTFNTAASKTAYVVATGADKVNPTIKDDKQYKTYEAAVRAATGANDWVTAVYSDGNDSTDTYTAFGEHTYDWYYAPETTGFTGYNWGGQNLFAGALVINEAYTMSLSNTEYFDWTKTSISFDWEAIMDNAATTNNYATYIHSLKLATSNLWFWDSMDVVLTVGEADDVSADAGVTADDATLDDDDDDITADDDDEPADDDDDDEPAPVVDEPAPVAPVATNPPTGNAPVALAVIPVALAAAAIVAKKRG